MITLTEYQFELLCKAILQAATADVFTIPEVRRTLDRLRESVGQSLVREEREGGCEL